MAHTATEKIRSEGGIHEKKRSVPLTRNKAPFKKMRICSNKEKTIERSTT